MNKIKGNYIMKLLFMFIYTLTILPFSINFFQHVATPTNSGQLLFAIIPLIAAHTFMLPLFLGALEFASIHLACTIWTRLYSKENILILLLFLGCQSIPVSAVYYDIRFKNYLTEEKAHQNSKIETIEAIKSTIASLKTQISKTSKELETVRRDSASNSVAIRQILNRPAKGKTNIEDLRQEKEDRSQLRNRRESETEILFKRRNFLEDDLRKEETALRSYIQSQNSDRPNSENEYMVKEFFTYKSMFAGLIALLFPVSILAVSYALARRSGNNMSETPSLNLQNHLQKAACLPADMHLNFAKILIPAIDAQYSAFKASGNVLNENDTLNLKHNLIRQLIGERKSLEEQIIASKLEESSKSYLVNEVNKIMQRLLKEKED